MAIGFWLARPQMVIPRIRYWFWERMNPDKPWLCPGTINRRDGRDGGPVFDRAR
jgi:hypothetical protein